MGGGVVLTLIHEIDYLAWVFGMPRRLFALGGHLSTLDVDVDDVASILAACTSDRGVLPVHLQMDYLRRPPRRTCSVLGENGSLDLDLRQNCLTIDDGNGQVKTLFNDADFDRNQLFLAELADFLVACATRSRPRVPLADGVAALRIALGVHESIRTGLPVEFS
jgi:predicted dehydrogenase